MQATRAISAPNVGEQRSAARIHQRRISWGVQRYLAVEVLKVFVFVFIILELVYALFFAVIVARRYDLDLLLVLPVFWRTALSMLNDSVPLALLFATGLVYGRFVADREVTALKSLGLSYRQLLLPVCLLGMVCVVLGFFINGYLVPEMNFAKRNIQGLLLAQLRYLGEGWNRSFDYGDKNLWIMHHNGRQLRGIFLSAQKDDAGGFLPEEIARRARSVAYPFYLFAEEGRILFPEEIEREEVEPGTERNGKDPGETSSSGGGVIFELYNVSVFFADALLSADNKDRTYFMQRPHMDQIRVPYDPDRRRTGPRRAKHLTLPGLFSRVAETGQALEKSASEKERQEYRTARNKLLTELHGRGAWTLSLLAYPLFAALVALFLNSPNRLVAFFTCSLIGPMVFYGLFSAGQVIGRAGVVPWLSMQASILVLFAMSGGLYFLLEKRVLR